MNKLQRVCKALADVSALVAWAACFICAVSYGHDGNIVMALVYSLLFIGASIVIAGEGRRENEY